MLSEGPLSLDKYQYQLFLFSIWLKILDLRWGEVTDDWARMYHQLLHYVTQTPTLD
jgi:hypothetical protein